MSDFNEMAEALRQKEREHLNSNNKESVMKNLLWGVLAKFLSLPFIRHYLIFRAKRTPYEHLSGYMLRWWLKPGREGQWDGGWRIHHILREDRDRHPHNHPGAFRSIILQGWYVEEYLDQQGHVQTRTVRAGDTYEAPLRHYHRIIQVSPGGVRTLCILGERRKEPWGFLENGVHVPSRVYFARKVSASVRTPVGGHLYRTSGREQTV